MYEFNKINSNNTSAVMCKLNTHLIDNDLNMLTWMNANTAIRSLSCMLTMFIEKINDRLSCWIMTN